jgi:hypothetical protein
MLLITLLVMAVQQSRFSSCRVVVGGRSAPVAGGVVQNVLAIELASKYFDTFGAASVASRTVRTAATEQKGRATLVFAVGVRPRGPSWRRNSSQIRLKRARRATTAVSRECRRPEVELELVKT